MRDRKNFITSLATDNPGYVWNDSANASDPDKWFRPSDVAVGTDGSLFIADWYDPVVGGHLMQDTIAYGRIYRIAPKNKSLRRPVIDFTSVEGQLEALRNPAVNVRFQALLHLRSQGEAVVGKVKSLLSDENPFVRYRAVWLLAQLGTKGQQAVEDLLSHDDEEIRVVAFRALRQLQSSVVSLAMKLKDDPSTAVRREVLIAIRDVPFEEKRDIVLTLSNAYDGDDPWYLEALGASVAGPEEAIYEFLVKGENTSNTPALQWRRRLSRFELSRHHDRHRHDMETRS